MVGLLPTHISLPEALVPASFAEHGARGSSPARCFQFSLSRVLTFGRDSSTLLSHS
jgi:hypothetical protein